MAESKFNFEEISCPVCGSDQTKFLGWRGGRAHQAGLGEETAIVRCRRCSHQYPNPMPIPVVSLEEIYISPVDYFQRHDLEEKKRQGVHLIEKFEERLGSKGRFLDVGCGRGELLWAAKRCGWECEGIDPSKEFVEFGREHLGIEAQVCTLEEAQFPADSFDAIAMGGIIEHLYNPSQVLAEVRRVLKPDGWLWLDAPNEDSLYSRIGNTYMRMSGKDWVIVLAPTFSPFHVQGFNPKSIGTLLRENDFVDVELEMFGDVSPQTGERTLKKSIEYQIGRGVNWLGKLFGQASYMSIWAQRSK